MRRVLKRLFVVGAAYSLVCVTPVMAGTERIGGKQGSQVLQLETKMINEVQSIDNRRGDYISSSHSSVTNAGGGAIGISGATTAHEPVDKIRIHLYLDRLDSDNKWTQVDDFDFTFTPEDDPSGELTIATVSFEVNNQPSGYYYRVRGTHGVWKNGVIETQSTRTNGVMITDTP